MTLTSTAMLRGIAAKKSKRVSDKTVKGFYARFNKNGSADFILRYKSPVTEKEVTLVIGRYGKLDGQLSIKEARELARTSRAKVELEQDPQFDKKVNRLARVDSHKRNQSIEKTIAVLSAKYLSSVQNSIRLATFKEKKLVMARLNEMCSSKSIANIDVSDALAMLDTVADEYGNSGAMKLIAHCSAFWNWTLEEQLFQGYNVWMNMKRRKKRYRPQPKSRWLDDGELSDLIENFYPVLGENIQRALLVSLYTNCRAGMASSVVIANGKYNQKIGMDWTEIKWHRREWTLSADRMKAHNEHVVPLSDQFYNLLYEWWEADGKPTSGPITHAATDKRKYLDGSVYAEAFQSKDYSPHDLRRTVSTQLQRLGCPDGPRKALRAHINRSDIASVYDIHDYLPERKQWLQRWADHLDSLGFDGLANKAKCKRLKIGIVEENNAIISAV